MPVINDTVYHLNTQLDRLQQHIIDNLPPNIFSPDDNIPKSEDHSLYQAITELQELIHLISVTSNSHTLLRPERLSILIAKVPRIIPEEYATSPELSAACASNVVWLLAAKATLQALGLIANGFLERTLYLNEEVLYCDDVLGSSWYTGFYTLQTSPCRIWQKAKSAYSGHDKIAIGWAQFQTIIRGCIHRPTTYYTRTTGWSPLTACRPEIRRKRKSLKAIKNVHACSIGLLMEACLSFETGDDVSTWNDCKFINEKLRDLVFRSIILMETILRNTASENGASKLEERIVTAARGEAASIKIENYSGAALQQPIIAIRRLVHILQELIPNHVNSAMTAIDTHRRPSRFVRYWLPFLFVTLSASTSLQFLTNRRAQLTQWLMDFGSTTFDFWNNWVVEPIKKLIGTIRHDEESAFAIMSKNSLEADQASLERMVVDFILDHRELDHGTLPTTNIREITNGVREGDLTPVLKAYERDLRTPFLGTIRGDLVRALLIQIQKTKVDVEIATSGIDALLKSQQLVFGFVGLTPGILVSYTVFCWISGLFGSRRGMQLGRKQEGLRRALRNVDRTLTSSVPKSNGVLSYKDHGLLICDAEVMLQKAALFLRGADLSGFREDIGDLINMQSGIDRQLRVIRRIAWTYSRWLQ